MCVKQIVCRAPCISRLHQGLFQVQASIRSKCATSRCGIRSLIRDQFPSDLTVTTYRPTARQTSQYSLRRLTERQIVQQRCIFVVALRLQYFSSTSECSKTKLGTIRLSCFYVVCQSIVYFAQFLEANRSCITVLAVNSLSYARL